MKHLGKLKSSQVRRKGGSDWVTAVDHASEEAIIKIIRRAFPDHAIVAEESSPGGSRRPTQWLIDPLDGTVNYLHSFPVFAVSVALVERGQLAVGVIFDPLRKELFTAQRGKGAWLNGKCIRVSSMRRFEDALLCTGFPFRRRKQFDLYLESFRKILHRTGWVRRPGSAAIDLAYAACGRADGFWEMGLNPWDVAAGVLLIQEAGGRVTDFFGGKDYLWGGSIVAGNATLHRKLLRVLAPIFRGQRLRSSSD